MKNYIAIVFLLLSAATAFAQRSPGGSSPCNAGDVLYYGTGFSCGPAQRQSTTVAGLPVCNAGTQGAMYFVTDALLPVALAAVGAGGAVKVGVMCNGTIWIVQ